MCFKSAVAIDRILRKHTMNKLSTIYLDFYFCGKIKVLKVKTKEI